MVDIASMNFFSNITRSSDLHEIKSRLGTLHLITCICRIRPGHGPEHGPENDYVDNSCWVQIKVVLCGSNKVIHATRGLKSTLMLRWDTIWFWGYDSNLGPIPLSADTSITVPCVLVTGLKSSARSAATRTTPTQLVLSIRLSGGVLSPARRISLQSVVKWNNILPVESDHRPEKCY